MRIQQKIGIALIASGICTAATYIIDDGLHTANQMVLVMICVAAGALMLSQKSKRKEDKFMKVGGE